MTPTFDNKNLVKRKIGIQDFVVVTIVLAVLYLIVDLGQGMNIPFSPEHKIAISLSPWELPYYAARSLFRMFIAYFLALLFSLVYGYIAAKNKVAEQILVPILDILQSIPVLCFLSATIIAFIAAFPGRLLGVECAAIFAIFTGQAWNITFSFYNSLKTVPKDLTEAAAVLRLNWWQRFLKLELPFSMIGLVWNSMMSFGGAWFFLAASEAISVLNENILLPGVGSYLSTAIDSGNMPAIVYSVIAMIIMIVGVDQFLWRPLVVWSQKFKIEMSEASSQPTSWVYDLLNNSKAVDWLTESVFAPLLKFFNTAVNHFATATEQSMNVIKRSPRSATIDKTVKYFFVAAFSILFLRALYVDVMFALSLGIDKLFGVALLGFYTFLRVLAAVLLGALWTIPVGVWIGTNPRAAKTMQPIVQIAASFPSNMLFPFVTLLFLRFGANFDIGCVALMMMGTQWYILFNVIAGAMAIPNDLHEAGAVFKLRGWSRWKKLILPSIFPFLITGAITASGGAWNASIVSELVNWHDKTLQATGIGAYIADVTNKGEWNGIIWGTTVMCVFVVITNRLLWRKLYSLAESKYRLD
ncbi:MAG: ABC transporter permease subunit [Negativicutes bacterium]|jgi:NitT/TauT family transport system permease protein